jgi:hypothetical protein
MRTAFISRDEGRINSMITFVKNQHTGKPDCQACQMIMKRMQEYFQKHQCFPRKFHEGHGQKCTY